MIGPHTNEEVVVLVKAVPQVGAKHGETVCCAGVTLEGQWRRMYPIKFRRLDAESKFSRWDVVRFRSSVPRDDLRWESRRVQEESIDIAGSLRQQRRPDLLLPLVRTSTRMASERGESLALIKPRSFSFAAKPMKPQIYESLRAAYKVAASQGSFFDQELQAFEPPRWHFFVSYEDDEGERHTNQCGDWETIAAYRNFAARYGEQQAIVRLREKYERYFAAGLLFAMGTVRKRPKQWMLLDLIRVDTPTGQLALL